VLVKGLDFSLLARVKAQLASGGQSDKTAEEIESELEKVFSIGGGGGSSEPQERSKSPSPAPAPLPPVEDDQARASAAKKKRTRDELIAQLKAEREAALRDQEAAEFERAKAMGKFKTVGQKKAAAEPADDKGKGKGKEIVVDGRKKRKKKKVRDAEHTAATAAASSGGFPKTTEERAEPREAGTQPEDIKQMPPPPPPPPIQDETDDDGDIFEGAGDYDLGISSESDEEQDVGGKGKKKEEREEGELVARGNADEARPTKRFKLFDDEDVSADPLPPPMPIPSRTTASPAAPIPSSSRGAGADEGEGGVGEERRRPQRLEGLSTSNIPSVRDLLDLDRAAEKEEARKARKEKYKNKAAGKKELSDADKVNRDWQRLQKHLSKSEKGQ
jgi:IK cytokine